MVRNVMDRVSAECGWDGWIGCEYKPAELSEGEHRAVWAG